MALPRGDVGCLYLKLSHWLKVGLLQLPFVFFHHSIWRIYSCPVVSNVFLDYFFLPPFAATYNRLRLIYKLVPGGYLFGNAPLLRDAWQADSIAHNAFPVSPWHLKALCARFVHYEVKECISTEAVEEKLFIDQLPVGAQHQNIG